MEGLATEGLYRVPGNRSVIMIIIIMIIITIIMIIIIIIIIISLQGSRGPDLPEV